MVRPQSFEKPTGFRDFTPPFARKKRLLEERLQRQFSKWGYQEILTPTLEFYDTVGSASAVAEQRMFKCMDREGNTLVLKPDQTAPIARVVASLLKEEPLPIRLSYHSSVFRAQESETGRKAELLQSGIELIGLAGPEADVEVIRLAMEAVRACESTPFQIAIGHIGLLDTWLKERIEQNEQVIALKQALEQRNLAGYQQYVEQWINDQKLKDELLALLRVRKHPQESPFFQGSLQTDHQHLLDAWELLMALGEAESIVFDPSLTGNVGYYTGIVFEAYAADSGFPLLSGGRYDQLLSSFKRPLPATGFALQLDRLLEVSSLQEVEPSSTWVYYEQAYKQKAFLVAQEMREQGNVVILKRVDSILVDQEIDRDDLHVIYIGKE
ncbi:ATP phosphoribosyltransferase regulatory subunit [Seinonella peptonophila]|uniref:ATP phosphoribosyltransferase regulatory subunit n=1 Tax=Seinonella peptonophila TaxID=112248 RepID=A0A1M4XNN4_9BACL|nr:ATP phosphoribosyltransferase regulatory subunit [Seinonella peptonophila]SHE95065.1 ATP phosphoribosyltransferase regulatory subunit [Seinonella peptonophila]